MFKFILLILVSVSCSQFSSVENGGRVESNFGFSIIQGSTDESSTILRLVYPGFLNPNFKIFEIESKKEIKTFEVRHYQKEYSGFRVTHILIDNLKTKIDYKLEVLTSEGMWKDSRIFSTLNPKKKNLKVLVASCMDDTFNDVGNKIWPMALGHKPDLVLLIGDNLYADIYSGIFVGSKLPAKPEQIWRRHIDHAMKLKINRMNKLTPILTTWDDHDYGVDDGDKHFEYKEPSMEMFRTFFPMKDNDITSQGYGVGSLTKISGQNIFLLDGRSFRDSKKEKNGMHFGKAQREWLKKNLSESNHLNWIISGDQFFGGYHTYESFEGLHPKEFQSFKTDIKESGKNVFFISGDRHFVELIKVPTSEIGKESFEITLSGIHAKMFPNNLEKFNNPKRIKGFAGKYNYGIFEASGNKVTLKAYSMDGLEFSYTYKP